MVTFYKKQALFTALELKIVSVFEIVTDANMKIFKTIALFPSKRYNKPVTIQRWNVYMNGMQFFAKEFCELTTTELYEILKARAEIFMIEQKIHYQDCDDTDYKSLHCFITENDKISAYLRAYYKDDDKSTVKVGRVLTVTHGIGLGKKLLKKSIPAIKSKMKCKKICMDAQKHAVGFYEKAGFKIVSGEFLEEGIVHVAMELDV